MSDTFAKFDLSGRAAFVTGGGTGLGYSMARALARAGATVMIAARRADVLADAAARISAEAGGARVLHTTFDATCFASIAQAVTHATATMGRVDIFIGNAAQDMLTPFEQISDDTITRMLQVNVGANIAFSRGFIPGMRERRWGRLVFSSSIASTRAPADDGMTVYAATKGALNAFARGLANEFGRDGITANSLILGVWETEMFHENLARIGPPLADQIRNAFTGMTSLGRLGNADELEGLIQLLCSDAGSYITGTESVIDGGMQVMAKPSMRQ